MLGDIGSFEAYVSVIPDGISWLADVKVPALMLEFRGVSVAGADAEEAQTNAVHWLMGTLSALEHQEARARLN